jgi:A/G-specific adenine glycosylase
VKSHADIPSPSPLDDAVIAEFVTSVVTQGRELYRDLPWRRSRDPYAVLVSEVMLQQTQVPRVLVRYDEWLGDFPTLEALAAAPLEAVLRAWQGLGYNRRAVALKRTAEQVVAASDAPATTVAAANATTAGVAPRPAQLPTEEAALRALPGIGPATAAGIRAFALDLPGVYLETNVRTVVLHELFADREGVSDRGIVPVLEAAVAEAVRRGITPREWYYALLDYGSYLKRTVPNPSRRSAHHTRQSKFEGSVRQKRSWLLRAVMASPAEPAETYAVDLAQAEQAAGREAPDSGLVLGILEALEAEGFLRCVEGLWTVR